MIFILLKTGYARVLHLFLPLDSILQSSTSFKSWTPFRWDFDFFARLWIAPSASIAFNAIKRTESTETNFFFGNVLLNASNKRIEKATCCCFRSFHVVGD